MAVTNMDEVNLVCCMAAQGKADLIKVARASNPDFFTDGGRLDHQRFVVHVMINPERELAFETFRLLQSTVATDVAEFAGGAVQLIGVCVAPGAPIAGKRQVDIAAEVGSLPMHTAGIDREGRMTVPRGGAIVHPSVTSLNEYLTFGGSTVQHDENGNELTDQAGAGPTLAYDFLNRLRVITAANGTDKVYHHYDAQGEKVPDHHSWQRAGHAVLHGVHLRRLGGDRGARRGEWTAGAIHPRRSA